MTRRCALSGAVAAIAVTAFFANAGPDAGNAQNMPTIHEIEITDFKFVPARLEVRPGDTIIWINRDIAPHTATAQDGSWDTGTIGKAGKQSVTVTSDMQRFYICRFHPVMKAEIVVLTN